MSEEKIEKLERTKIEIEELKRRIKIARYIFYGLIVFFLSFSFIPDLTTLVLYIFRAISLISLIVLYLTFAVKIVKDWQGVAIYRLGKYKRKHGPGLIMTFWPFDKIIFEKTWEVEVEIPLQEVITEDNVVLEVDGVLNCRVYDVYKYISNVKDPVQMLAKLGQAAIRNSIGSMDLDNVSREKEKIGDEVKDYLNLSTGFSDEKGKEIEYNDKKEKERRKGWGIEVTRVKIKKLDPPEDIKEAMHLQVIAEREKIAKVVAAEAEKEAKILIAEGEAKAVREYYKALKEEDPDLSIKGLETLEAMAQGKASTIFMGGGENSLLKTLIAVSKVVESTKQE